ncbi:arsenate reductase (glutaredoxin) [Marinicella sp. W31]|uniref:arsenate reductase (glutaredoxin) n=1 Tax=Marinicella sp. W31 TaxID=3023713 RepID=UPI00375810F9
MTKTALYLTMTAFFKDTLIMADCRIYHNPRCSKSRATLALLQEHGANFDVIEYLKDTPDIDTLKNILALLNISARELLRTGEQEYKALNLSDTHLTDNQLIDAMHKNPRLIERPIVVCGNKAIIGRPPENVLDILS